MIDKIWFKIFASVTLFIFWSVYIYSETTQVISIDITWPVIFLSFVVMSISSLSMIFDCNKRIEEWVKSKISGSTIGLKIARYIAPVLMQACFVTIAMSPFLVYGGLGYIDFVKGGSSLHPDIKMMRVFFGFSLISANIIFILRPITLKLFKISG